MLGQLLFQSCGGAGQPVNEKKSFEGCLLKMPLIWKCRDSFRFSSFWTYSLLVRSYCHNSWEHFSSFFLVSNPLVCRAPFCLARGASAAAQQPRSENSDSCIVRIVVVKLTCSSLLAMKYFMAMDYLQWLNILFLFIIHKHVLTKQPNARKLILVFFWASE